MNLTNLSNFSSPSSFTPSPVNATAPSPSSFTPSPVNATAPSPSTFTPSPVNATAPSPVFRTPSPFHSFAPSPQNTTFHRFNHSTSVSSLRQTEINFFIAYVAISFGVVLVFLFVTRKHILNLLKDSRQYVDVAPGDTELKRVFRSDGESKSYGFAQLDEMEEKSRTVGKGVDI